MSAPSTVANAAHLLEMRGIDKSFSGIHALRGVDLRLDAGEVLGLVGENGAGKSTLIKVLGGAHAPDRGEVLLDGLRARIASPIDAQEAGISVIYQEFNLIPALSARENIFLGREKTRAGFFDRRDERARAEALFGKIGVDIDPETPCNRLTVAQQQTVEIAKALSLNARIIVMDEPTSALTGKEVEKLFEIVAELKRNGIGIVFISHRLDDIFAVADRVMFLRDGDHIGTRAIGALTRTEMIELMVGRKIEDEFPKERCEIGRERLRVEGLTRGSAVLDVSFSLHAGEVLGLTGLVGAGRTETARLIFGADTPDAGKVFVDGAEVRIGSPRKAIALGICLLTEDRKAQGLVLIHSVRENFGLPNMDRLSSWGFIDAARERREFAEYVKRIDIRLPHQDAPVRNLSGGNQQKVVLAKWLARDCDVILFDEPTRGIDVGAKHEVYLLVNELARQGKAILMISSELPEILGMSDRIIVMHEGRVNGEIADVENATQEEIMHMAMSPTARGASACAAR